MGWLGSLGAGMVLDILKDTTSELVDDFHATAKEKVRQALETEKTGDDILWGLALAGTAAAAMVSGGKLPAAETAREKLDNGEPAIADS
jgi:hypothetical protein